MLAGGNGAGFNWGQSDWLDLARALAELDEPLLLTSSRRTGAAAEVWLCSALSGSRLAKAVWWSRDPQPVVGEFLRQSNLVVCTADSMSMITEVVAAGRPLLVVLPRQSKPEQRYLDQLRRLESAGYLRLLNLTSETKLPKRLDNWRPYAMQSGDWLNDVFKAE